MYPCILDILNICRNPGFWNTHRFNSYKCFMQGKDQIKRITLILGHLSFMFEYASSVDLKLIECEKMENFKYCHI